MTATKTRTETTTRDKYIIVCDYLAVPPEIESYRQICAISSASFTSGVTDRGAYLRSFNSIEEAKQFLDGNNGISFNCKMTIAKVTEVLLYQGNVGK